jgi:hypothetical protein
MKKSILIFALLIVSLFSTNISVFSKNDTVFISNSNFDQVAGFNAAFQTAYTNIAKNDIGLIQGLDDNYKKIIGQIKSTIYNDRVCDPNLVIPFLRSHGSLRYILGYKKMFVIYFREIQSMRTYPESVYYITDDQGNFLYVELKDVYQKKHMVFDQAMLKDIRVNKKDLRELGLNIR